MVLDSLMCQAAHSCRRHDAKILQSALVRYIRQALPSKTLSVESEGDNLRLSSCSAPSYRASGRQATKSTSGRGSRHCCAIKRYYFSRSRWWSLSGRLPESPLLRLATRHGMRDKRLRRALPPRSAKFHRRRPPSPSLMFRKPRS